MASRHSFIRAVTPILSLPGILTQQSTQDTKYERIKTEEHTHSNTRGNGTSPRRPHALIGAFQQLFAPCSRRLVFSTLGLVVFLLLVIKFLPVNHQKPTTFPVLADHKLYLLIPSSNDPEVEFCRTELTAGILGYPTPDILNREGSGRSAAESERDKIRITNGHLNSMGEDHNGDLVILLNNANSWFQLRPEVLMERYYTVVERANRRLEKDGNGKVSFTHPIVMTAQPHCSGHQLDELACLAPKSPIDKASTIRFSNADLIVGPVRDMRKLFNRMNGKLVARKDEEISQQTILAEIFGEQEFRREYVRQGSWFSTKKKLDSVLKTLGYSESSVTNIVTGRKLPDNPKSAAYEMGISLDYGNELGLSRSDDTDGESVDWIRHEPSYQQALTSLPQDIARSMPPFWSTKSSSLPTHQTWADVPLLTSKRTDGIPAAISVADQSRGYGKEGLNWMSFWAHAHARELWEVQQEIPRLPLMSVLDGKGTEHIFWNQELKMDRDGANWIDGGWKPWTDHCGWGPAGEVVVRNAGHEES